MKTLNTTHVILNELDKMTKEEKLNYFNGKTSINGELCSIGVLNTLYNHGYSFKIDKASILDYDFNNRSF